MYKKLDLLNSADKDLLCEFIYCSMNRVLNRNITTWERPIPQGVSVFMAHPETGSCEYMFTKDDKYPVVRDNYDDVISHLETYANVKAGGVILYLNSCMMPIISKHKQYSY